jgi:NADPH2:quinone reductase
MLEEQGVTERVEHGSDAGETALRRLGEREGFDLVVEMLANVNLELDLELLQKRGRVVVVGSRGKIELTPRLLMRAESDVRGAMLYGSTPGDLREIHASIAAAGEDGTIAPVIQKSVPLERADEAHRAVIEDHSAGKIILTP